MKTLLELQARDEVLYYPAVGPPVVKRVHRVTKQQVSILMRPHYEEMFWKKNGQQVGGSQSWRTASIRAAEASEIEKWRVQMRERALARKIMEHIDKRKLHDLSIEQLSTILSIVAPDVHDRGEENKHAEH